VPTCDLQWVSSEMETFARLRLPVFRGGKASCHVCQVPDLRSWRGQAMREIFRLASLLPLFLNARPQLNLIRIIWLRRAATLEKRAAGQNENKCGSHVGHHAIAPPDFNNKPNTTAHPHLRMRFEIVRRTGHPAPVNSRSNFIVVHVTVRLPGTSTSAQDSQAQENDDRKKCATVSTRSNGNRGHQIKVLPTDDSSRGS
jgi:hypothetical protein